VKVENAEATAAAAVVLQATGVDAPPMKLTTRQQELYKRGSGLRSLDKRFRRCVMSLDKRARNGGYPGGYEDRYRMDYAYRKERLNQNLNFDSLREALLIVAGPRHDPNWRGGTGKSAAAYGNAVNPDHQAEYRVGQLDAWAVQRKKGAKGKGKRNVRIDNHEQRAWYDRLDLAPAERPEGENPRGQVANSASQWINDESQWTDYPDDRSRKSARLSWYNDTSTPSSLRQQRRCTQRSPPGRARSGREARPRAIVGESRTTVPSH
jgi:hypothetical protein